VFTIHDTLPWYNAILAPPTDDPADPHLLRRLRNMLDKSHDLGVLSFEMTAGTLFRWLPTTA